MSDFQQLPRLNLYQIDDGERHWIVATDPTSALKAWRRQWDNGGMVPRVTIVDPDAWLVIAYDEQPDPDRLPATPFQDPMGNWYCAATVAQWVQASTDGELLCSSIV